MLLAADFTTATNLAVAGLAGLAVGIEREWSGHASGPQARFAGARTFLLLGLLGGLGGWFLAHGLAGPAVATLTGGAAFTVAAYIMAARKGGDAVEGTTEAAALVVLALGALSGMGHIGVTAAVTAVMVLALVEKSTIQGFIRRIGEREMQGALHFAVLALVLLPLLPEGPYGPLGGIRPRSLWTVVLLFSGLNFAGYLAQKATGDARGHSITGLLAGLISSTAVTLHFSRQSREEPQLSQALAQGVLNACTVLLPRVALISLVLNPVLTLELVPFLLPPFLVGAGFVAAAFLPAPNFAVVAPPARRSPLQLRSAIRMALAFQAVLMAIEFVRQTWGQPGVLTSAVFLGLTDMDALTLSMTRLAHEPGVAQLAARAVGLGILSNTFMKLGIALVVGAPGFRRRTGVGLGALAAASAFGLWLSL